MSALDDLKKKNPLDMTMLEFVVTQAEYSEVTGNAEHAAQELADKDAKLLALCSELDAAKARAKTAEENWHKNEARLGRDGLIFLDCMKLLGLDVSGTDPEAIPAAIKRLKGAA